MKKSEYTVTMPIADYEKFCQYKEKYEELTQKLKDCYDLNTHKNFPNEPIRFDPIKANEVSKGYLPSIYSDVRIIIQ